MENLSHYRRVEMAIYVSNNPLAIPGSGISGLVLQ
jgi:hypothetical protein